MATVPQVSILDRLADKTLHYLLDFAMKQNSPFYQVVRWSMRMRFCHFGNDLRRPRSGSHIVTMPPCLEDPSA